MKIEQLLQLTEMGFTKDDIMRLCSDDPAPAPAAAPDPEPAPDPAPVEPAAPSAAPADDRITALETKLDYAINRLNYMAVQGSQQPAGKEESLDDILSSVVRGFQKEDNK